MIPPKIIIKGNHRQASAFLGYSKKALHTLQCNMSFQGLNVGYQILYPAPGISVELWASFSMQRILITVAPIPEKEILKKIEPEIEKLDFLKIFVHVDVILKEDWAIDGTNSYTGPDRLTRDLVTSAMACGVVNTSDNTLVWSDSVISDYLTNSGGTDWEGVDDDISSTVNGIIEYYNTFFPAYVPVNEVIADGWVTATTNSVWGNLYDSEVALRSTYVCTGSDDTNTDPNITECELTTPASIGWYTPTFFELSWISDGNYSGGENDLYWLHYSDSFKEMDLVGDTAFSTTSAAIYKYYPYGYGWLTYPQTNHDHDFCSLCATNPENVNNYEIRHTDYRRHDVSPILGVMWSGNYQMIDVEEWSYVDPVSGSVISYTHWLSQVQHRFLITGYNGMSYPMPTNFTFQRPISYTVKMGDTLNKNYKLSSGFTWYQGSIGELISSDDWYQITQGTTAVLGNRVFRTLMNLSAVQGYNLDILKISPENNLSAVLAILAKKAIVTAGGTIYDNADIPISDRSGVKDFMDTVEDDNNYELYELSGIVYASPLLNISIYAIPAQGEL